MMAPETGVQMLMHMIYGPLAGLNIRTKQHNLDGHHHQQRNKYITFHLKHNLCIKAHQIKQYGPLP
jgi:hypothetical protein